MGHLWMLRRSSESKKTTGCSTGTSSASMLYRSLLSRQTDGPWLSHSDNVPANIEGDIEGEFVQEHICQKDTGQ